ncbi:MAG TPA: hypothetical protein VFZ66_07910 [Herpetosiphonaceae bacterium]
MTANLQHLIGEAQVLSPQEQVELISAVSQFLHQSYQPPLIADFWQPKTPDQLIQAQAIQPVRDISDLVFDDWPEGETVDDMVAYIEQQRHADRFHRA